METEELTIDKLRDLATSLDRHGEVDLNKSAKDNNDLGDKNQDKESESEDTNDQNEPDVSENEHEEDTGEESGDESESSETRDKDNAEDLKKIKDRERQDRSWKKLEEEKAELRRQQKEFQEKERRTVDIRDEKDADNCSVKDYENAAKYFHEEGNEEFAKQAEDKAKALFVSILQKRWSDNFAELVEAEPTLSDTKSPLYVAASKVLQSLPFLNSMPDGCVYAVRIAQGDVSKSLISELKAENEKIKKELDRLNKATRVGSGGPGKMPSADNSGKSFDDLPSKDRLAILRRKAERADMGYFDE